MSGYLVAFGLMAFGVGYSVGGWVTFRLWVNPQQARIAALQASAADSARAVDMLIAENQQLRRELLVATRSSETRPLVAPGSLFNWN